MKNESFCAHSFSIRWAYLICFSCFTEVLPTPHGVVAETKAKHEKKEDSDKPAETTQQNSEHK
jgi:hypothetical protein